MKKYLLLLLIIPAVMLFSGCDPSRWESVQQKEEKAVEQNQKELANKVSIPQLTSSLERINIKKRLEIFDDPNKISYIYLVSYGKVMSFFTIKGKVSSGNKRLTTNQKVRTSSVNNLTLESPSLDGAYGSSNPYIFFWTTDGIYIQWAGEYMLADQPLKLQTPPEIIREIK